MQKLKTIDYITSLVAAILWLLGGILLLSIVGFTAKHGIPGYGQSPQSSPIYALVGLLLYTGFVIGAWLVVKWCLPLFIRITKQGNLRQTVHKYILFSWLSIFSLLLADVIAEDNLMINIGIWTLVLAGIYLIARYKTT